MNDTVKELLKLLEGSLELEPPIYYHLFFHISNLLICLISTSANILILLANFKYKDKKNALYVYLRNFLICDVLYIITNAIEYEMRSIRFNEITPEINCVTLSTANTIRSINILFLLTLVYQWFFEKTKVTLFETYPQFISLCLWIGLMLQMLILLTTCSMDLKLDYGGNSLQLALLMFDIFLCVFMLVRKCANPFSKTFGSLPIAVANALPIFWTIPLITGFIAMNLHAQSKFTQIGIQTINMMVFLYPLITFYIFYRMDNKFKRGLKLVFGRELSLEEKLDFYKDTKDIKMEPVA